MMGTAFMLGVLVGLGIGQLIHAAVRAATRGR